MLKVIERVKIPNFEQINVSNTRISEGLKSLCSKGPSFAPMPCNVNSLEILQNLSNFKNKIRWRTFFAKRSQNDESNGSNTETEQPGAPPKIKKLTKQTPKSSFPEIETFLANVERDIFENCKNKKWVRDNLTSDERLALNTWRKEVLFNSDSDLVMRLQDKGNRFVIVDKQTDKFQAEQQISKSNFIRLDYDPTEEHTSKVSSWASKWYERQEISEEWSKFVVNLEAKLAKKAPYIKLILITRQ